MIAGLMRGAAALALTLALGAPASFAVAQVAPVERIEGRERSGPIVVRDGKFDAVVSADQMSRIAVEGDKIVSVRTMNEPEGPQMLVEAEEVTGDVYVAFDGDVLGRSFSLYLITQNGRTVQATLSPSAVAAQNVVVSLGAATTPAGTQEETVQRTERRSGYMETVTALVRVMFNGDAPAGVSRVTHARQSRRVGPYDLRLLDTYEVAGLRGQVLSITNSSTATVPIVVDTFLVAGVMAASADRDELMPGGSGRIFLVEEVR